MKRLLGIDYGEKRIGLAVSDDQGIMAFPHSVIPGGKGAVEAVVAVAREQGADTLVMGQSNDYQGKPNAIMTKANAFAEELKASGFTVAFESELLSSHQASHFQGKTAMTDAAAASIILQSYIDRTKRAS